MAQKICFTLLLLYLVIMIWGGIITSVETSLRGYKGHQIIDIDKDFLLGKFIMIINPKTSETTLVRVYDIAIKDYKVGDVIR